MCLRGPCQHTHTHTHTHTHNQLHQPHSLPSGHGHILTYTVRQGRERQKLGIHSNSVMLRAGRAQREGWGWGFGKKVFQGQQQRSPPEQSGFPLGFFQRTHLWFCLARGLALKGCGCGLLFSCTVTLLLRDCGNLWKEVGCLCN